MPCMGGTYMLTSIPLSPTLTKLILPPPSLQQLYQQTLRQALQRIRRSTKQGYSDLLKQQEQLSQRTAGH